MHEIVEESLFVVVAVVLHHVLLMRKTIAIPLTLQLIALLILLHTVHYYGTGGDETSSRFHSRYHDMPLLWPRPRMFFLGEKSWHFRGLRICRSYILYVHET